MPIGVRLANPDRPVLAVVGDGSSLYTITALWTAAHHRLPIIWVILNNASYRILKENLRRDGVDAASADQLIGADLVDPALDFVSLARGFGVRAQRVENPAQVGPVLAEAFASGHPFLLDLAISGDLSQT
jgi:benzoylformate decarboxylase